MRNLPYFRINFDATFEKPILCLVKKIVWNGLLPSVEPFAPQPLVEAIGSDSKSEFDLDEGVCAVLPDIDDDNLAWFCVIFDAIESSKVSLELFWIAMLHC